MAMMTLKRDGLFDVLVHKILVEANLQPETIFQCSLAIPGMTFSAKASKHWKIVSASKSASKRTLCTNMSKSPSLSSGDLKKKRTKMFKRLNARPETLALIAYHTSRLEYTLRSQL